MIDIALDINAIGIGLEAWILKTLGRLNPNDHLLTCAKGIVTIGESVQGEMAVTAAVPTPVNMIVPITVIAIDIEGMAHSRIVVISQVYNRAPSLELGLNKISPLSIAVIGIVQIIGLEQQLGILVILKELDRP